MKSLHARLFTSEDLNTYLSALTYLHSKCIFIEEYMFYSNINMLMVRFVNVGEARY